MKVVLLDRDGTVIAEPDNRCVDTPEKIKLFDDTIEALQLLAANDIGVVFVTNQTGVGDGRMTEEAYYAMHEVVLERLKPSGVTILKTYENFEANLPDNSYMRKPGPGMMLLAAEELGFDTAEVYMIGDRPTDVEAGRRAGCKGTILLQTTESNITSDDATYVAKNLLDAVQFVVATSSSLLPRKTLMVE